MEPNNKIENYFATRVDHPALNWSGQDVQSYLEYIEHYQDLPLDLLSEEYLSGLMEDVIDIYSDQIIEFINSYVLQYLTEHKQIIYKEIQKQK
jgi:hypothetical protein